MKQPDYIFAGIKEYLRDLDKDSWKWNQIVRGIKILQNETLHIFVVGTESYGQAETLKLLAPPEEAPGNIAYNCKPFKPYNYENAHLCLWESPGLGRLDCNHKDLVEKSVSIIQNNIPSNLFIFLFILNIKRFGLSYEEDFINQLRTKSTCICSDIDSHIVFALNTASTADQNLCNKFISEAEEILNYNLFLGSTILPFCPSNKQPCLELKAKLLISSAALFHKYSQ